MSLKIIGNLNHKDQAIILKLTRQSSLHRAGFSDERYCQHEDKYLLFYLNEWTLMKDSSK